MGKIITPKYRVEYRDNDIGTRREFDVIGTRRIWDNVPRHTKTMVWMVKEHGAPNEKNLEQWRVKMNDAFNHGGINYHVSLAAHVLIHISHARIVNQKTGEIVASVTMPMFEVV